MYEACFGLERRPFAPVPEVDQYFPGEAIETARQTLTRCLQRAEGAGMVVGPSGTGKTLLCHVLAEQFRESLAVALLCSGRLSSRSALYQAVLYELGRPYRGMDEGELRLALVDYLTTCDHRPEGLVLLVDEAHTLSLRLLDAIRMLTNLVCNGQSRVRVLLVGGPLLEEQFASPKLESFAQRMVARCYLESFSRAETQQYIRAQVDASGGEGLQVFTTEATDAVYQATDGVPRLVNQLCDHALLLGCTEGRNEIDAREIEEAWADLQQLPTPWNDDEMDGPGGGDVIEFGGLDDDLLPGGEDSRTETPEAASLRLTPVEEAAPHEPSEQIERIERTLAELGEEESFEEDFQPAGTIGPEITLVFDDWKNPFDEHFEDEEVVVERYPTSAPNRQPAAAYHAGQETAEPLASEAPAAEAPAPQVTVDVEPTAATEEPEPEVEADIDVQATLPMCRQDEAESAEAFEDDLIVIEEGYEPGAARSAANVVVTRRHEYRQLFAKLRQG